MGTQGFPPRKTWQAGSGGLPSTSEETEAGRGADCPRGQADLGPHPGLDAPPLTPFHSPSHALR